MKIRIAQLVVGNRVEDNLQAIIAVLQNSEAGEWIIFPEGMLSGYEPENANYIINLDSDTIASSLDQINAVAQSIGVNCIVGTALKEESFWFNASIVMFSDGRRETYKKNNLSYVDRNHFMQGNQLITYKEGGFIFGIQMCREIVFPEQWKVLKKKSAQIVFHLNNALKSHDAIWCNLVIARAIENQIFVCSVNNASSPQTLPSFLISPKGEILFESQSQTEEIEIIEIDLSVVQNYYLSQERTDLVNLQYDE